VFEKELKAYKITATGAVYNLKQDLP
jgi:hypothetical protein